MRFLSCVLKPCTHTGSFFSTSPLGCHTPSGHFQCECKLSCLERPGSLANKPGVSHKAEVAGISVPDRAFPFSPENAAS